ncbi:MAG: type VI secretion system baseplate subunit TssG [Deltaproteobacteria bacterium]|nr:type VI secretion system baseplate subunit TssG [Deltaproteobacteria bacterium]
MEPYSWGTDHPIEKLLFEEGHRFEFFQAVKLLEILYPEWVSVGEGVEPGKEAVRFKAKVDLQFPAGDLAEVIPPESDGKPAKMIVNFMGLAGVLGPLPPLYTELILDRVWNKDTALRDFLDIFNHRLISLMYRVRKKHRIGFEFKSPEHSHFARYLFSLMGLGTKGLQGRMKVEDRALLFHTSYLAQQPRSMIGLESLLSDYFKVKVKGIQFCGQWHLLEKDQISYIGISGQNQILGLNAVAGTRVWDQQGKFAICIGPLTLRDFLDFLPIGDVFTPLCELTRFYVGTELDFEVRLILKGDEVPESRLAGKDGPRLGWTSWLKTRRFQDEYAQVRLSTSLVDFKLSYG